MYRKVGGKPGALRGKRPKIRVIVVNQLGAFVCQHGRRPEDVLGCTRDWDALCSMAANVIFSYIDVMRCCGYVPSIDYGTAEFCCPKRSTCSEQQIVRE